MGITRRPSISNSSAIFSENRESSIFVGIRTTLQTRLFAITAYVSKETKCLMSETIDICFAVLGYLVGFTEFARLNIFLAFFSMIPISDLDGNKIFFGSQIMWSFLAAITLIGLGYAFFLI